MKVIEKEVGPKGIERFLVNRGYVKTGRTMNYDIEGNVVADFVVYSKNAFEVVLNFIEGVVGINYNGKPLMTYNKSMVQHQDCFKSFISEMEGLLIK